MQILTEEELSARLDYRRPLESAPEVPEREPLYCIPFEYGSNTKGTLISLALAKTIAAELRAAIAEHDKRELYRAFKQEEQRCRSLMEQVTAANDRHFDALGEMNAMRMKLQAARRARRKK